MNSYVCMNSYTWWPMNSYIRLKVWIHIPSDLSFHAFEFICIRSLFGIFVNPHMHTISLCAMGSTYANFSAIRARLHTGIPICIWRSPCAKLRIWGYKTKFPVCAQLHYAYGEWLKNPRMHMGISVHPIPVCIQGSWKSPYAYGDYILIPVCIRGLHDLRSLYAYGDWSWPPYAYRDLINPRMHTGIDMKWYPNWEW